MDQDKVRSTPAPFFPHAVQPLLPGDWSCATVTGCAG